VFIRALVEGKERPREALPPGGGPASHDSSD
jgi:hypothetical protein